MVYNGNNLIEVLEAHKKWLAGDPEGSRADLFGKNLSGADLSSRDLSNADLRCTDFTGTDFTGANLSGAYCRGADLSGADFTDAVFTGKTSFDGAVFSPETKISYPLACPETGSFTAYKAASGGYVVKLFIPWDAKRSSSTGKKCRCDKAKVVSIQNVNGSSVDTNTAHSIWNFDFIYRVGEMVTVPNFDECRWHECTSGIHFFMDRKDAVNYLYSY